MYKRQVRLATPYLYAATGEMFGQRSGVLNLGVEGVMLMGCLLYTSDAADERSSVDLGGRRIIKKKKHIVRTHVPTSN